MPFGETIQCLGAAKFFDFRSVPSKKRFVVEGQMIMKKRKGSLLQRMMAVLLAAALVVCMVSYEAPATVLADEPVSVSENTPEPVEGETEPAQGEDSDGQEDPEAAEGEEETKPEEPKQEEPKEETPQPGGGAEQEMPSDDGKEETQEPGREEKKPGPVSDNDAPAENDGENTAADEENGILQSLLARIEALPDVEEYLATEPDVDSGEADEGDYEKWLAELYAYAEEALAIQEAIEELSEEERAGIPEEALAKLAAWTAAAQTAEKSVQVMAAEPAPQADNIASGDGWVLDTDGKLTITSDDGMTDWRSNKEALKSNVKSVEICSGVTSIIVNAFYACSSLTNITISESVTSIGESAFSGCSDLAGVTIPASVESIATGVFQNCSSLTKITIPEDVKSIESSAFSGCSSLTEITIPDSVTNIGYTAFKGCSSMVKVTMKGETPPALSGGDTFSGCPCVEDTTKGIHVPAGALEAYRGTVGKEKGWGPYENNITDGTTSAETHNHNDVTFTAWTKTDSLPTDAGNYYLTENVTLTSTWWVPSGETTLCLNGKTISGSGNNVIGIGGSITLNLYDCQNAGNITGGEDNAVWINNNGAFYMYGGEISDNDWTGSSRSENGAICVASGTFYMHGGNISGNTAKGSGGVYIINSGTFKMYGGEISDNTAPYGSGVYVGINCTFQMQGGEITNNTVTASYGGGVFSYGNITVGGEAKITGNKTSGAAGNVYLKSDKTIEVLTDTPLTGSAKIGVSMETAPTERKPVNVTGHNKGDYSGFFVSDNPAYEIINESDTVKLVLPHRHTPVKQEKVPADCTHPGTGEYWKCEGTTGCGKMFSDQACTQEISTKPVLPALGHSYDSAWKKDAGGHWYECSSCGDKKDQAEHTYDDDSDTDCNICGYQRTAAHTHTLTRVDAKSATCTEDGNTAYYVCGGNDGCGKYFLDAAGKQEITDKDSVKIPKTGHDFDVLTWGYKEADGHAHKCRNCNEHDTVLAHTPGDAATTTTPRTCTVCGYIIAPAIGHTHEYGEWQHDNTQHWKVCACGAETDRGNHEYGDWVIDKKATATEAGKKHRDCRTCAYTETKSIPKTGGGNRPGGGNKPGGGDQDDGDHGDGDGNQGGAGDDAGADAAGDNHGGGSDGSSGGNSGGGGSDGGSGGNSGGSSSGGGSGAGNTAGNTGGTGAGTSKKPGTGQPKVKQEKEGNIRKEVRVEGEDTLDAAMEIPLSELADMVLTKEEKQQAAAGTNIRIVLDVKDAAAVIGAADKTIVEMALHGSLAKGYTLGQYLDIDLFKIIGDSRSDITETAHKITVVIRVPDSLKNTDGEKTRTFAVIRVHGGKAELLADLDNNEDTITIATDRFSTYAVVYKDMAGKNSVVRISVEDGSKKSGDAKDDEPKTGDNTPLELCATLSMIAGFTYLLLYFADRRHGMTEETKKELVSRLVAWAKQGGRFRRWIVLAAIFVLLVYYHSIGKKMSTEWKAVYGE